jgi:hypothetical protein
MNPCEVEAALGGGVVGLALLFQMNPCEVEALDTTETTSRW